VFMLAVLVLVSATVGAVVWLLVVYPTGAPLGRGREVEVRVEEGEDIDAAAARLEAAGVVESAWLFAAYVRLLGADDDLRTGALGLTDRMTPAEVANKVAHGLARSDVRVTVPEGFNRFEIARRLEVNGVCPAQAFLEATQDPQVLADVEVRAASAEGYLFPDTYDLRGDMRPRAVVGRMVNTFNRKTLPLLDSYAADLAELRRELRFGLPEVLTLASIVEKEAAVAEERPIIAGVFLNRLLSPDFRPRRLQADPTVSYGCLVAPDVSAACRAFDGRHITRSMLGDTSNPYNTYRMEGLPPGPIANPGLDSVRAVLRARHHGYFYFVARGGGRHHFSVTLEEHNRAVGQLTRPREGERTVAP